MTIILYMVSEISTATDRFLFVILSHFLQFYPPNSPKIEYKYIYIYIKKWKHLEISSFYTGVPKLMIIGYAVLEIWCMTDVIVVFHFGQFFTLLTPEKWKIQKKEKEPWRYHQFTQVYQKPWLYATLFLRYGLWPM